MSTSTDTTDRSIRRSRTRRMAVRGVIAAGALALLASCSPSQMRSWYDSQGIDHSKMSATYVRIPALADVPYPVQMEPNLVVEFYSR